MTSSSEDDLEIIDFRAGAVGEADVIFIFGTRHWTPAELAAQLFLDGHAPLIVTTGGSDRHPKQLSEAVIHRELVIAAGVPSEAVIAETNHRRALVTLARHAPSIERIYAADYEPFNTDRRIALSRANWRDSCPRSVEREREYMENFVASGVDVLARTDAGWTRTA